MGDFDYRPDYRGTAELMRTEEMRAAMITAATEAIPFARSISPDAAPYGVGYVDAWVVDSSDERIANAKRAVAHLINTEPYADVVELGKVGDVSRADTGHHVLARTADHIERG